MMHQTFIVSILLILCLANVLSCKKSKMCVESPTTASGTHAPTERFCSGDLIFEEKFDKLDQEVWQHEMTMWGGGNDEFQWYTNNRSNSFVTDGHLNIKPTLTADVIGENELRNGTVNIHGGTPRDACTQPSNNGCIRSGVPPNKIINPIISAKLRSVESFNFKYGKAVVRAKLPAGDWIWPAIWLMPKLTEYGGWPASGEIDLMESRGNKNLFDRDNAVNVGCEQVGQTLHYGPYRPVNGYLYTTVGTNSPRGQGFDLAFHDYGFEWTPTTFSFSIDGKVTNFMNISADGGFFNRGRFAEIGDIDNPWKRDGLMAPFDREFYFMFNIAVGGTNYYFGDDMINLNGRPKPWKNTSPRAAADFWDKKNDWLPTWKLNENNGKSASLLIDYVRVWAL